MADTRPTKLNFFHKIYLCFLVILFPEQLKREQEKDEERRKQMPSYEKDEREHSAYVVRRAFWNSLGLIVFFGLVGCIVGSMLSNFIGHPTRRVLTILQVIGASLLLWGTLFVRGWEIQIFSDVSLVERVNRWIYRFLYCIGTSIMVCSLVW